jgi:predicted alpha/beta hydrolase family esterase
VRYPDLPEPFDPQPDAWLAALEPELAALEGERVVLCHSLACLLWLLRARDAGDKAADRVLLVAPACALDIEPIRRFWPAGVDASHVRAAAEQTHMLCSDVDPYCPEGAASTFGIPLELDYDVIPGGGHLNTDAGYGPWPDVEAWALSGPAPS